MFLPSLLEVDVLASFQTRSLIGRANFPRCDASLEGEISTIQPHNAGTTKITNLVRYHYPDRVTSVSLSTSASASLQFGHDKAKG